MTAHCGSQRSAMGLLYALAFSGMVCSTVFAAEYQVFVVTPAITNHVIQQDGPLPPVCKAATTIELAACRGEYEPASFVVDAAGPLSAVRIEVGQLTGPGGKLPRDCVDVRVVKDYYTYAMADFYNTVLPMLLVHDESFLGIEPDPTEKQLGRMKNVARGPVRDAAKLLPVDVTKRKQFWITVHVPETADPGSYETVIRIVPGNGPTTELTLRLEVRLFELLPPMLDYSIYYPAYLEATWIKPDSKYMFTNLSEERYRIELQNLRAHGISNPNLFEGVGKKPDGSLDFTKLDRILTLRESVGMPRKALYLLGHPLSMKTRPLSSDERSQIERQASEIRSWVRQRGYPDVFLSAHDEAWGNRLAGERDSMAAVHAGGAQVFVAVMHTMFFDRVGDVLHRPVLGARANTQVRVATEKYDRKTFVSHFDEIGKAGSFQRMSNRPDFRKAIDGIHRQGRKILTYMNPSGGTPLPELQRRNEGLGLWRVGFDGTMTWAYTHNSGGDAQQALHHAKVFRTENGVLDTLHWEGYREGVDDVRYLTTLFATLRDAAGRFPKEPLIAETFAWLTNIDAATGDLDTIRSKMAERIVALLDLGYETRSQAEWLADIDLQTVDVVTMPEPWPFKIDTQDQGVKGRWFDPAVDHSQWARIRTDQESGWDKQGFGGDQTVGYGWYRAPLPLTGAQLKKPFKYLYFEASDEDAWVYVNGQEVFEHSNSSTGLPPEDLWLTPFVVPLTSVGPEGRAIKTVDLQNDNVLAVRVYNSQSMGGLWKPVHLILSEEHLGSEHLAALVKRQHRKATEN
jgi:hypothetical protein